MKILTRKDTDVGAGTFDSIKWAIEEHMKEKDDGTYNYGTLEGNEDSPTRIRLWKQDPQWKTPPDRTWTPCTCDHSASDVITDPYCLQHGSLTGRATRMQLMAPIDESDITGAFDGSRVTSDADPGL